jgi:hypothetical protein
MKDYFANTRNQETYEDWCRILFETDDWNVEIKPNTELARYLRHVWKFSMQDVLEGRPTGNMLWHHVIYMLYDLNGYDDPWGEAEEEEDGPVEYDSADENISYYGW